MAADSVPEAVERERPDAPARFSPQAVHLVRTAMQINVTLSQMADQKASILLGATFVVFTIAVGQVGSSGFSHALLVLAITAFVSAFFAVAAVLPAISSPRSGIDNANILFFAVFTTMSEEEFTSRMLPRLADEEAMFRTMLRDIYQSGQVLARRKYRFLGIAYRIFVVGLSLTMVVFLIESREVLLSLL